VESQSRDLDLIASARAAVADRLVTPAWYHPILGLLVAGYIVALSLGGTVVRSLAIVLFITACGALAGAYRRRTGVWVSGFKAGRASRWAVALGLLIGGLTMTGLFIGFGWFGSTGLVWLLAAVGFVATIVLGRRFDVALRSQLRAGGA
jgi:hypothetical protein